MSLTSLETLSIVYFSFGEDKMSIIHRNLKKLSSCSCIHFFPKSIHRAATMQTESNKEETQKRLMSMLSRTRKLRVA